MLALPAGWERIDPPTGATFAARSRDGGGEATLRIDRDPALDLGAFEARSLRQLRAVAGGAEVVDRVPGPTPEQTIIRLGAKARGSQGTTYEVTLRASGPYRYFLSTTLGPDASSVARAGVDLIQTSFFPGRE
jgi:hypothetical protein